MYVAHGKKPLPRTFADLCLLMTPQMLKPKCTEALRRIFKVSDVDKDGLLNASELNQFQVRHVYIIRS
jgi:Ca2+-binding EF-hand superfamily protein